MWSDKLLKMVVQEYSGDSSRKIFSMIGIQQDVGLGVSTEMCMDAELV